MKKYILLLFVAQFLVACSNTVEEYYLNHPLLLQKAAQACPAKTPQSITCDEIIKMQMRVQQLVYQLQSSPQVFGNQILALQQKIVQQQYILERNFNIQLAADFYHNKQELQYRLAVVKWLESPQRG